MPQALEHWQVMPHGDLEEIDDGILTVAGEIRMPLGNFPRRMTAVRLAGERTAIYSAIALDEPQMARIEAMGRPAVLIVPGDGHRLDAKIWKQRYPGIKVLTPAGARAAVEAVVPVDAVTDILEDPDVRFVTAPGTGGHESALVVRRGGDLTLICNDLIGNVRHPHGLGANVMARLFGFGVNEPQTPKPVRRKIVDDPAALAKQFRAWADDENLRRIIVSHGDPIEDDPRHVLHELADRLEETAH